MSKVIHNLLDNIIREEEALNRRYAELSRYLDHPLLAEKFQEYQKQGWVRIGELHGIWKSMQDPKP
ncbi:MAG: hypothetical protein M0021_05415 [Clostridia bacterium]|nr:hypothetical protein [Clostridia bacterium]